MNAPVSDFYPYILGFFSVGLGIWVTVYILNRIYLGFKDIVQG